METARCIESPQSSLWALFQATPVDPNAPRWSKLILDCLVNGQALSDSKFGEYATLPPERFREYYAFAETSKATCVAAMQTVLQLPAKVYEAALDEKASTVLNICDLWHRLIDQSGHSEAIQTYFPDLKCFNHGIVLGTGNPMELMGSLIQPGDQLLSIFPTDDVVIYDEITEEPLAMPSPESESVVNTLDLGTAALGLGAIAVTGLVIKYAPSVIQQIKKWCGWS